MKAVLPSLTGQSYEDLAIRDGNTASPQISQIEDCLGAFLY